jgi:MoxR-like ATPase
VLRYAGRLIGATHPDRSQVESVKKYVRYGASPRGMQTLILAGKVRALLEGRFNVAFEDLAAVAAPALRHRIFLQFEAEADAVSSDQVVSDVLEQTQKDPSQK